MFRPRRFSAWSYQLFELDLCFWIGSRNRRPEQKKVPIGSHSEVIAVIGTQFVSERLKSSANSVPTKISGRLREANDAHPPGLGELWLGKAFHIFVWLRGNALANPELTSRRRFVKGKAISFCVECLAHSSRDGAIGQRT